MNNGVVGAIAFTLGAAAGSIVTWLLVKKKYEKQAHDDVQEVREYYAEKYQDKKEDLGYAQIQDSSDECDDDYDSDAADIARIDYSKIIKDEGYTNEEKGVGTAPYVIAPEEYGEADDYEMISLTSYADGVLADDWDEPVEDIANTVGADYASHFGEYEDDSVFVRNERLKVDYEILADPRRFEDVAHAGPSLDHDE